MEFDSIMNYQLYNQYDTSVAKCGFNLRILEQPLYIISQAKACKTSVY